VADRIVAGDGVDLAVREWGDPAQPTVVLVHGFPDTSAIWIPTAEVLADHGLHAVAYDVRGAGESGAPGTVDGYRIDHLIDDLRAVADAVSPDRPVHLVGHDWGSIQSWDAVTSDRMAGRIASFTSISGIGLDQAGLWLRERLRQRDVVTLLRQGFRSSYVLLFHALHGSGIAWRTRGATTRARRLWAGVLSRVEGARIDADYPAATFGTDVAQGMGLYRANFRSKLRHPVARRTAVPVQLVLPNKDRFVPAWLFDGIEEVAPDVRRREVPFRHWGALRAAPVDTASWIAALVEEVEGRAAPATASETASA
jgi:pimeloyl-ACP methyl ester carboxylesterase